MSAEPLSDGELDAIEKRGGWEKFVADDGEVGLRSTSTTDTARLVAEVRRLRALRESVSPRPPQEELIKAVMERIEPVMPNATEREVVAAGAVYEVLDRLEAVGVSPPSPSDEEIKAAAKAIAEYEYGPTGWDRMMPNQQHRLLGKARCALDAARPRAVIECRQCDARVNFVSDSSPLYGWEFTTETGWLCPNHAAAAPTPPNTPAEPK